MMTEPTAATAEANPIVQADVIITGGTSGLGAAFARLYASLGHSILITGRRADELTLTAQAIQAEYGVRCTPMCNDLYRADDLERLTAYISSNTQLKALINNAGFNIDGEFHSLSLEQHQSMLTTHVTATTLLTHAAMPQLIANRGDAIIVASMAALLPTPMSPLYGPTKLYLKQFAATLAAGYRRQGVRVIALCPGFFRSEFHPKLGLDPDRFYRTRGLFKARDADQVAKDALNDLRKGKTTSVSGWNYRLLYWFLSIVPQRLLIAASAAKRKARF